MSTAIRAFVPYVHVRSVPESIAFYRRLGFEVENTFTPPEASEPTWANLHSGAARLMVAAAVMPIDATLQGVLFYAYVDDVQATWERLRADGITVSPIATPFYNPKGEFRIEDPDGYTIMIAHT